MPDLDRAYIEAACRSPLSVLVMEQVAPGRSLDVKDVLTGARFHVLEAFASRSLRPADLLFASILSLDGVSLVLGCAPFVVPPAWHTPIINWRQQLFRNRLMTRADLEEFDIDIRDLYFHIAGELADPTPPRLTNTDGDPLALTTLTYELRGTVDEALEKLSGLALVHGEDHREVERDASGVATGATLSWMKAGNPAHKSWDNTMLGTLRLEPGRLTADVNSTRRADRLKREIKKRLGHAAVLTGATVVDPAEGLVEAARRHAAGVRPDEPSDESLPPELEGVQEEMMRRQWDEWLDTRVPALQNRTPRQAARSRIGRERLEALLADFERHAEEGSQTTKEHLARIRSALGL